MTDLDRRTLLRLTGLGLGVGAITGCTSTAGPSSSPTGAAGKLVWWDQFLPTQQVEQEIFDEFAAGEGGVPVDYSVYDPAKMGQSLQLAKQSGQMPDVFTLAGVGVPSSALMEQGWFAPIEVSDDLRDELPAGTLLEGVTVFDGKVYGLPLFGWRMHDALNWFNRDLFAEAGLDPDAPPVSYDEVRAAARAIQRTGAAGWIAPLQFTDRIAAQIHQLAEAAGSPSAGGVDLRTGEYVVDNEYYLNAIEWWVALQADKVLFPGSGSLNARTARARWAAGAAGMFFDGPYCIGVVAQDFAAFEGSVGVGQIPIPDPAGQVAINHVVRGSTLWLSATSQQQQAASALLSIMVGKDAQLRLLTGMNAPAIHPGIVGEADVHPTFRKAVEFCDRMDFLAPDPLVANPDVAKVQAASKPVEPGLGEIVAGVLSQDVPDARAALAKLRGDLTAARETAIGQAVGKGAEVGPDDWRFPDWQRGQDYTTQPRR